MFSTLAVLFAVRWGKSRSWQAIVASGVAAGAATACKPPGALVLVPIGIYVVAREHASIRSLLQVCAFGASALCAFALAYVPALGNMPEQVRYMLHFQSLQRSRGHVVQIGGRVYRHPPWWAQFRWQWDASWVMALGFLVLLVVAIVAARRDANMALLVGVLGINLVFFAFISGNVLAHYPYAWAPAAAAISGIALWMLVSNGRSLGRVAAVTLAIFLIVPAVQLINRTAHIRSTNYAATATFLRHTLGGHPDVVLIGYNNVLRAYLPHVNLVKDTRHASASAFVIDPRVDHRSSLPFALSAHRQAFTLREIGQLKVYVANAPHGQP